SYLLTALPSGVRAAIAAGLAAAGSWWVSGRIARVFARRLVETETVTRRDLLGATGRAVLAIGPSAGVAQVHDRRGNLHQVHVRTLAGEGALPPGAEILLVDYDEEARVYRAVANPRLLGGA